MFSESTPWCFMTSSFVSIVQEKDTYMAVKEALDNLEINLSGKVLIKPNLTLNVPQHRRACTNPHVVSALIDIIREHGGIPSVGESSMVGCDTLTASVSSGIQSVCDEKNVTFIDFNRCHPLKIKAQGEFVKELTVAKELLTFDKIISVPVMKTHVLTGVSLGMKNMKGVQYRDEKIRLHEKGMKMLHVGIVDIVQTITPYLTVIDGSYGQEGEGPVGGNIVNMDVIVASKDVVAADATACRIMGINPHNISHIALAGKRQIGNIDKITLIGEDLNTVAKKFDFPHSVYKRFKYKLLDFGMDFAAKLKNTTEANRAYKTIMKLMQTMPIIHHTCQKCGKCLLVCPHNAITPVYSIDLQKCKSCMICMEACPHHAIKSKEISLLHATKEIIICFSHVTIKKLLGKL